DLTLLLSGVRARAGVFDFGQALLVGTAGGFVGDSLSYFIGARFRGRARSLGFYERARPRLERLMRKFGVLSVFIVKYVYGLRTARAVFYWLGHFWFSKVAPLTLASCGVWGAILTSPGFTFSTGLEKLIGGITRVQIILLLAAIILITIYVISRFERRVIEEDKEFFGDNDEQ